MQYGPALRGAAMTTRNSSVPSELAPPPPPARWHQEDNPSTAATVAPCVRLMCSFGGRILPRPHDNQLRYVGGDTRIVALHRSATSFPSLLSKLSKFTATPDITIKYQLPNEDLDALISVTSDEDVENMMEEYDRLLANSTGSSNSRTPRLRLFLFPSDGAGGFGSMLSTSSSKHEHWFVDALNGRPLERGRSEASSIVSEVPDYFFGLDNNLDEPLAKQKTGVSVSDPGSPAPVMSSPQYGSTSSVASLPPMPDLPPVKTKPETTENLSGQEVNQQAGYMPNPVWQYVEPVPLPVYYMPGPSQGGPLPVRPVQQVQAPMQYVQRVQAPMAASRQTPVGYRPVYMGGQPAGRPMMVGGYDYPMGPTGVTTEAHDAPTSGWVMRNNQVPMPMYHQAATGVQPEGQPPGTAGSLPDARIARPSQ